jgi:hypothetical protein
MFYSLKKSEPAFEMMTGPLAGRRFEHDRVYFDIPEEHKDRFKKHTVKQAAAPKKTKQDKEGDK